MNKVSRYSRVIMSAGCCAGLLVSHSAFGQTTSTFQSSPTSQIKTLSAEDVQAQFPRPTGMGVAPSFPRGTSDNSLSDLFTDLVGDFRNLPSKDSAKWLGIGAGIALLGHAGDANVTHTLTSMKLGQSLSSGTVIGGTPMQIGGAFATYAIGRIAGSSRTAKVGAELFRAQILTQSITTLVKVAADRTRPDGTDYSFPSGHTASAFATATVLQRNFGWKVGVPAYALAAYVGTSRIEAERHFFSDVAFGAALGILAGRTVTIGPKDARFAVAPFATTGGGGVGFSWVPASN